MSKDTKQSPCQPQGDTNHISPLKNNPNNEEPFMQTAEKSVQKPRMSVMDDMMGQNYQQRDNNSMSMSLESLFLEEQLQRQDQMEEMEADHKRDQNNQGLNAPQVLVGSYTNSSYTSSYGRLLLEQNDDDFLEIRAELYCGQNEEDQGSLEMEYGGEGMIGQMNKDKDKDNDQQLLNKTQTKKGKGIMNSKKLNNSQEDKNKDRANIKQNEQFIKMLMKKSLSIGDMKKLYKKETRNVKIERYLMKKAKRIGNAGNNSKIAYKCRSEVANSRQRDKGRFVKVEKKSDEKRGGLKGGNGCIELRVKGSVGIKGSEKEEQREQEMGMVQKRQDEHEIQNRSMAMEVQEAQSWQLCKKNQQVNSRQNICTNPIGQSVTIAHQFALSSTSYSSPLIRSSDQKPPPLPTTQTSSNKRSQTKNQTHDQNQNQNDVISEFMTD